MLGRSGKVGAGQSFDTSAPMREPVPKHGQNLATTRAPLLRPIVRTGLRAVVYSAAFSWKPFSIMSDGATGYSPEKQASQYCGHFALRPCASPTAR